MLKQQLRIKIIKLSIFILLFFSSAAFAKYDLDANRGVYTQPFVTPYQNVTEICVMPKHLVGVKYKEKDWKDEATLCSLDFYGKTTLNGTPLEYVAVCPKVRSTNPGVELYKLKEEGLTVAQYEKKQCSLPSKKREKSKAKRMAKFKQSISCSYTPSILAYYHVSRMLGGVGNVQPAVIRTMSLKEHRKIAKRGYQTARRYKLRVQGLTWKMFIDTENNIDNRRNRYGRKYSNVIFTTDNKQIFGAMQKDVKKEGRYREFYIKNYKNSYKRLTAQPFVRQLISRKSQQKQTVEKLYQLKDYADMLTIDYLLSQEDRFGNIAYKDYYYSLDKDGKIDRKRVPKTKEKQYSQEQMEQYNIHKVRRLVLKDNDCGVKRYNRTKKSRIMSKIRHMSLATYQRVLWMESKIEAEDTELFFQNELLFSHKDWEKFEGLVKSLKDTLQKRCRQGNLVLDLNPERKLLSLPPVKAKQMCERPSWGDLILQ